MDVRAWTGSIWLKRRWALVNAIMNLRVAQNAGSFLMTSREPVGFSRRTLLYGVSKYPTTEGSCITLVYGGWRWQRGGGY